MRIIKERIFLNKPSADKSTTDSPLEIYKLVLIRALRANSFRKICKSEAMDSTTWASKMSVGLLLTILTGLALYGASEFKLSIWNSALIVAAAVFVLLILAVRNVLSHMFNYLLFLGIWLIAGLSEIMRGDMTGALITLFVPFMLVIGVRWTMRAVALATNVPLFIPVALILVLLPLLTEDPWRLAAEANIRLVLLACLLILPLATVLIWRLAKTDVAPILKTVLHKIEANRAEEIAKTLQKFAQREKEKLDLEFVTRQLRLSYGRQNSDHIEELQQLGQRSLRFLAIRRAASLTLGVVLALWLLIYGLSWAAVPPSLAGEWSKTTVSFQHIEVFNAAIQAPLGPYILVSALLSIVACVGFLSFALTEDQYSKAVWEAILVEPAERFVLLALPYTAVASRVPSGKRS